MVVPSLSRGLAECIDCLWEMVKGKANDSVCVGILLRIMLQYLHFGYKHISRIVYLHNAALPCDDTIELLADRINRAARCILVVSDVC